MKIKEKENLKKENLKKNLVEQELLNAEENYAPKGKSFNPKERTLTRVEGDFTYINAGNLARQYKLGKVYTKVRNLEMRYGRDLELLTFLKFKERFKHLFVALDATEKPRPEFPENERYLRTKTLRLYPKGTVLVMVSNLIYDAVKASIDRYVMDLAYEGYWATIHVVTGGTPQQMRAYMKARNPVGVVLVGALPVPWYELAEDFHGSSEFPCDLYYMDLNGTWTDPDGDGKFQSHEGNLDPEIWVGRIWSPVNDGNDTTLINDYFERNHRFRTGKLGHARRALAYVDDDWQGFDDCAMDLMMPSANITTYTAPNQTDADLYKSEVNTLRAWVQLCAHSWPQGHAFTVNTGHEYVDSNYFSNVNPPNAHFYNLFCCGPGRFTDNDYLGGWYIFDKSGNGTNHGMAAVASTKTGSMLFFEDFYRPMGEGKTVGEALVEWWKARGPAHDLGEIQWHYGMALLGDPTLNWWVGAVPTLLYPENGDIFNHWPRRLEFRWDPVNIPGAVYEVEIDYYTGYWAEENGRPTTHYHNVIGTSVVHNFVGMQPGRWRVRAKVGTQNCNWSPWSYFRFDI